jgi:hypothetical protein
MAYSRWGNSFWYTYWASSDNKHDKHEQLFEICDPVGNLQFNYLEIKQDIDKCLESVRDFYKKEKEVEYIIPNDHSKSAKVKAKSYSLNEETLEELRSYMLRFLEDVDNTFYGKYKL